MFTLIVDYDGIAVDDADYAVLGGKGEGGEENKEEKD